MIADEVQTREVAIPVGGVTLNGELTVPPGSRGLVVFAHGSGSSRHSPRNQLVASVIQSSNIGTLLFDLLTESEEAIDIHTRHLRFDIGLLARRLEAAATWLKRVEQTKHLSLGLFGSSTGAAAALVAAARLGDVVKAVVSRGGRPDLAGDELQSVKSPVLLIVGGLDHAVIGLNRQAYESLRCIKEMTIVPGATHLFEEPGTLMTVARLAATWFERYLE